MKPRRVLSPKQPAQISMLAGYGLTREQVSRVFGVSVDYLKRYCAKDFKFYTQKPAELTPEQRSAIKTLAGFGLTQEQVGDALEVSANTIHKHCAAEWKVGKVKADAAVLTNLFKIATGSTPQAVSAAIFWVKVRMRWHEVQRVIHGFDPSIVVDFVRQVTALLRRELPELCPHCKTKLDLPVKVAAKLRSLSDKMADNLKPSEIVPIDRDGIEGKEGTRG